MSETLKKVSGKFLILLLITGLTFAVAAVLSTVEASAAAQHFEVTTKAGLNLRQSTSTKSSVLKTIPYNTTIKITDYKTANGYDWGKTTYGGKTGWLAMKYVEPCARIKDGTYVISPKCAPNSGLDVSGKSNANGANVQIWNITDGGGDNQHFKITYLSNGFYKITAVHSGKVLDVANGSSASGTKVWQYKWNGTAAQQWQIIDGGNGYYVLTNRIADKALDVSNGSSANGTQVQVYNRNNTTAQLWKIKKFSDTTSNQYTESKVKVTKTGQVVDTFNGVSAKYIPGLYNSDTGTYCCAQYVKNYYKKIYGISVSNLTTGKTPLANKGKFQKTTSPKAGDIVYHTNSKGSGHWMILKSVNSDGTYTVIEQNSKYKSGSSTYAYKNRHISSNGKNGSHKVSNLKFFRYVK